MHQGQSTARTALDRHHRMRQRRAMARGSSVSRSRAHRPVVPREFGAKFLENRLDSAVEADGGERVLRLPNNGGSEECLCFFEANHQEDRGRFLFHGAPPVRRAFAQMRHAEMPWVAHFSSRRASSSHFSNHSSGTQTRPWYRMVAPRSLKARIAFERALMTEALRASASTRRGR